MTARMLLIFARHSKRFSNELWVFKAAGAQLARNFGSNIRRVQLKGGTSQGENAKDGGLMEYYVVGSRSDDWFSRKGGMSIALVLRFNGIVMDNAVYFFLTGPRPKNYHIKSHRTCEFK